jgi:hypothetical protein
MRAAPGRGILVGIIVIALIAAVAYTAYAGTSVYQELDSGRQSLVAAQARMNAAGHSGDPAQLQAASRELKQAEQDFEAAKQRSSSDPALRLTAGLPILGHQVEAGRHLAAIGADLSRAGESAAIVAVQLAALKQKYATRRLTPADLEAALKEAQGVAATYSTSTKAIGDQLKAAHAERDLVTTTDLMPPLRDTYVQVDRALADADTAFLRYQDVRQVLSDFLGVRLPT